MTLFHLAVLDHDHSDRAEGILAALSGVSDIHRAFDVAFHGNDDSTDSAESMLADHRISLDREVHWVVALRGARPEAAGPDRHGLRLLRADDQVRPADVVGAAIVVVPLLDNLGTAGDISIHVAEPWRRRGVGRALSGAVDHLASRIGRTVLMGWSDQRASDAPDALRPRDGRHGIAPDPGTAFATAMGYHLAQAERHSVQDLPSYQFPRPRLASGYRLVSWAGPTPAEHLDQVAQLQYAMSTDAPIGELHFEPEVWDAARVRAADLDIARTADTIVTLAIREADQAPAGFTQLYRRRSKPAVVEQWNTVVSRPHRGHGLGLALKQANLLLLAERWPQAERVHTWNASENDHMWAINKQLGYRTASIAAGWLKRLDA